jgi:DNA polymerase elongation subunit (family B)
MNELFHFDIESCGEYPTWQEFELNDPKGAELFEKKYHKLNWEEKHGSLDVAYLETSPIVSTFGRICCISYGFWNEDEKRISSSVNHDEKELLLDFKKVLEKVSTKKFDLCGYRVVYFDIPFILHKMHKYGIVPPAILDIYDKKPWEMRVRDISDDWRQKFAWSFSFDEVCYELGVESPKSDLDGSKVHGEFWKQTESSLERIKTYCEKDVSASMDVEKILYKK